MSSDPPPSLNSPGYVAGHRLRRFHEMPIGESADAFALVAEAVTATTREGKPYVKLLLRDRRRAVTSFIWSNHPTFETARRLRAGEVCKIRGRLINDEKWGPKLELDNLRPADPARDAADFQLSELFESTRFDVDAMWRELHEILDVHIADSAVRDVVRAVLRRHEPAIKLAPAASRNHHAVVGGLLEHTLSVTRLCVHLADKYIDYYGPTGVTLDKGMVVAGGVLHDLGKVFELDTRPGVNEYTRVGRLVGHILLGRDMLREAAATVPSLSPEKLMLLEHIIIGHQGKKEWSSPIEPRTLECLLVHQADNTDAKVNMFIDALRGELGGHEFTSRRNAFGQELFRGRITEPDMDPDMRSNNGSPEMEPDIGER